MYVQCKVYVQLWRRLKAYNRVIFVQNCPDTANKLEKNFSCNVNTEIKDAVVVPVPQTGSNSLPSAEGAPPEVIPVWGNQRELRPRRIFAAPATTNRNASALVASLSSPFPYWLVCPDLEQKGNEEKLSSDQDPKKQSPQWDMERGSVLGSEFMRNCWYKQCFQWWKTGRTCDPLSSSAEGIPGQSSNAAYTSLEGSVTLACSTGNDTHLVVSLKVCTPSLSHTSGKLGGLEVFFTLWQMIFLAIVKSGYFERCMFLNGCNTHLKIEMFGVLLKFKSWREDFQSIVEFG